MPDQPGRTPSWADCPPDDDIERVPMVPYVEPDEGRSLSSTEEAAMSGDSHEVLAPRRSHCCDCHREFWGRSVRCPDCYAAALTEAETCACGGGTVGLVQREGDKVTRHHAQICGWEQDAGRLPRRPR